MSLRRSLILVLVAVLTLAGALAAAFSYFSVRDEVSDMLDAQQLQIANFVGNGAAITTGESVQGGEEAHEEFVVEVLFKDGTPPRRTNPDVALPQDITPGYTVFSNHEDGWRLFTLVKDNRIVRVAQRLDARNEIAEESALGAALPFLFAIPASWLLVTSLAGAVTGKLTKVATAIDKREPNDTSAVNLAEVPVEVRPLVEAMNRAFARSQAAIEQQSTFLANAAHELRTPLAAVTLQIGNLKKAIKDPALTDRVSDLDEGIRRAAKLTDQLLGLARQDAGERTSKMVEVDLAEVVKDVMAGLMTLAESNKVDLGATNLEAFKLLGDERDLRVFIETIIDNAVRYTPQGGKVDVALEAGAQGAIVTVTDTGPGIDEAAMPHVFDRFFRAANQDQPGSGLGLSIAKMIADRYGYGIKLTNRSDRSGLIVTLTFPKLANL